MSGQRAQRRPPPPPPRPGRRSSTLVLGLVGLLVAGAAIAAIMLSQSGSSASGSGTPGTSAVASGSAQVAGSALPAYVEGAVDAAVGLKAPEVEGASFDGRPVTIKADGRPKLLVFIAHWCSHCQAEVPVVQRWVDANGVRPAVDLISVVTAIDSSLPNYPPDAWLVREHWSVPVIVDGDRQIATEYGLTAFPYWVVVGADGAVVHRITGELSTAQLDALVASVTAP